MTTLRGDGLLGTVQREEGEPLVRRCPRCTFPLAIVERQGVELDHCRRCGGNFFDAREAAAVYGELADPASWEETPLAKAATTHALSCPAGHGPMRAYRASWGAEQVEVDLCPGCRGLWLDGSEGKKLVGLVRDAAPFLDHEKFPQYRKPGVVSYLFQLMSGFPIEVWNPLRQRPYLVYALIVLLIGCYLVEMAALEAAAHKGGFEAALRLLGLWACVPAEVTQGRNLWTMITHAFLHIGPAHLLGNLYFLYVFGDNVEDALGRGRFLLLYLLSAVGGAALHVAYLPDSVQPMLGASGAIAGLMGAYAVLFPRVQVWTVLLFVRFRLSVLWYLGFFLAIQVLMLLAGVSGVSWMAHIGGFVAGVVLALLLRGRAGEPMRLVRPA
jgi:membrane associated rhomboid family serine protease/Zn-finger nucleic acid-binding protein